MLTVPWRINETQPLLISDETDSQEGTQLSVVGKVMKTSRAVKKLSKIPT